MAKTVIIKGFIAQSSWSEKPYLIHAEAGDDCEWEICHRPIEVEVPISSLRFDPKDTLIRDRIMSFQKVKALEKKKAQKCLEIEKIKQEIQELLSIEAPKAPAPSSKSIDDDIPF